jgi:hypothetical protein
MADEPHGGAPHKGARSARLEAFVLWTFETWI